MVDLYSDLGSRDVKIDEQVPFRVEVYYRGKFDKVRLDGGKATFFALLGKTNIIRFV